MENDETDRAGSLVEGSVLAGRYRVAKVVSVGANTVLLDAVDLENDGGVTVKIVRPELAGDDEFRRKFRRLAEISNALTHPNIASVADWGEVEFDGESTVFWVVDALGGGSLRDLLDRGRLLEPGQALVVGLEACRALDAAHQKGLFHTELNPSKMVFGADRRLRVVDFGMARLLAEPSWTDVASLPTHVARYASPEQALGLPIDSKTDVYALALVLTEAVTGSVPFAADSTVATLSARVDKLLPVSADLGALAAVLERAARPESPDRFTAAEFGRSLVQAAPKLPKPTPIPIIATGLFDTTALRRPSDPTGGVERPAPATGLAGVVDAEETPEAELPVVDDAADVAEVAEDDTLVVDTVQVDTVQVEAAPADPEAADEAAANAEIADGATDQLDDVDTERAAGDAVIDLDAPQVDVPDEPTNDLSGESVAGDDDPGDDDAGDDVAGGAVAGGGVAGGDVAADDGDAPSDDAESPGEVEPVDSASFDDAESSDADTADDVAEPAVAEPAVAEPKPAGEAAAGAVSDDGPQRTEQMPIAEVRAAEVAGEPTLGIATVVAESGAVDVYDEEAKSTGRRKGPIVLLALLLLAGLGALGYAGSLLLQTKSFEVPVLAGVPNDQALNQIAGNDWEITTLRERSDSFPVPDTVIRTDPGPGVDIEEGEPFTLVLSEGPEFRQLPELSDLSFDAAVAQLMDLGLEGVAAVEPQFSETVVTGSVLAWRVLGDADGTMVAGSDILPGRTVEMTLSSGPEPRTVPELGGQTLEQATAALTELRLVLAQGDDVFSDDVPVGQIVSQSPLADEQLERDGTVTVQVSQGPDVVVFPSLEGLSYAEAQTLLLELGLQIGTLLGTTDGTFVDARIDDEQVDPGVELRRGVVIDLIFL